MGAWNKVQDISSHKLHIPYFFSNIHDWTLKDYILVAWRKSMSEADVLLTAGADCVCFMVRSDTKQKKWP